MGTAMEAHGPVAIRGAEHWCRAFHDWVCAGVAVRDVVTREPIAVLGICCWRNPLPESAGGWLANALTMTQYPLKRRARDSGAELVAACAQARAHSGGALAAVDTAGKVVIADDMASVLLGVPACTPAVDPTLRWNPGLPELIAAVRYATGQAAHDSDWVGSTQIFARLADEPTSIGFRPVFSSGHLIGHLVSFGASDGARVPQVEGPRTPGPHTPGPRVLEWGRAGWSRYAATGWCCCGCRRSPSPSRGETTCGSPPIRAGCGPPP